MNKATSAITNVTLIDKCPCGNCIHNKVCKHKSEFMSYYTKHISAEHPQTMKINITCSHYLPEAVGIRNREVSDDAYHKSETWEQQTFLAQCTDCSFYKECLMDGKVYVGDSPCQWCSKSNLRPTSTCESEIKVSTATDSLAKTNTLKPTFKNKTIINE